MVTTTEEVEAFIDSKSMENTVLLMMSSGNFDGIDYDELGESIIRKV